MNTMKHVYVSCCIDSSLKGFYIKSLLYDLYNSRHFNSNYLATRYVVVMLHGLE